MSRDRGRAAAREAVASKKVEEAKKIAEIFKSRIVTEVTIGDKTCVLKGDGDREEFNRCLDSAKKLNPYVTVQFGNDACTINNIANKDEFLLCNERFYEYVGDVYIIVGDENNKCTISDLVDIEQDPCFLGLSAEVQSFFNSLG